MPARHTGATEKIYRISSSKCHIQKFCFRIIAEGYIRGNTLRPKVLFTCYVSRFLALLNPLPPYQQASERGPPSCADVRFSSPPLVK